MQLASKLLEKCMALWPSRGGRLWLCHWESGLSLSDSESEAEEMGNGDETEESGDPPAKKRKAMKKGRGR